MADEQVETQEHSLLERLREQIRILERIEVGGDAKAQLDGVIAALESDVEDLRRIAPHIFIFVPKR